MKRTSSASARPWLAILGWSLFAWDEVNMDRLASRLLGVVDKTMQPERADLRLIE